ncbi:MAG: 30S ribosomal protein S8 [Candidatus Schekmanbacteria bacterium RBG_13_48_7]|uniref:Small ribosomal subunit protein uS8 n=1 Tax=Candidatus Schekmanbacteria bacterium RBG_13_48_7 TaxID=1817878 RepID=A0A1F7S3R4_9BACT|nr:ribosomal protein S8 [uncultured bacterium]OGL47737.1 MAG: 30S ribosomal protein S8 [Candidatus Schekmanbacteria bacterium RBG_13_48_7]
MTMTDPVADMITRIRNGVTAQKENVNIPSSGIKREILRVLKEEGFIQDFGEHSEDKSHVVLNVKLKYGSRNQKVINGIQRVSKPGRRIYKKGSEIRRFRNGLGFSIISTDRGVMTDRDSMKKGLGGEVLINIW